MGSQTRGGLGTAVAPGAARDACPQGAWGGVGWAGKWGLFIPHSSLAITLFPNEKQNACCPVKEDFLRRNCPLSGGARGAEQEAQRGTPGTRRLLLHRLLCLLMVAFKQYVHIYIPFCVHISYLKMGGKPLRFLLCGAQVKCPQQGHLGAGGGQCPQRREEGRVPGRVASILGTCRHVAVPAT